MKITAANPIVFNNQNESAPRQALEMLRSYNSDAMKTAKLANQGLDGSQQAAPDSTGGVARPDVQGGEIARRMGLVGMYIDVYA